MEDLLPPWQPLLPQRASPRRTLDPAASRKQIPPAGALLPSLPGRRTRDSV